MRVFTNFWRFPIFRLLLPLVVGIGSADVLFQDALSEIGLCGMAGALLLAMLVVGRWQGYAYRWLFGGLTFLFLGCLGALLVLHERHQVCYEWPLERSAYQGVICDPPQEKAKTYLCKVRVDRRIATDQFVPVNRTLFIYIVKDSLSQALQTGDRLQFYTRVAAPLPTALPGKFDYARYLFRQHISGTAVVFAGDWQKMGERAPLSFRQRAALWRQRILQTYRCWGFSGDEFAVLSALTVGYKGGLTPELRETFQQAGVSHILALSGMHIAILWGLLSGMMQWLNRKRIGRWVRCLVILGVLTVFAFLTGLSPSVVRAVVMCVLMSVLQTSDRISYAENALGITAFAMLLYRPFYLFDVGFQLSFLAVLVIVVYAPLLQQCLKVHHPVLRYVWKLMVVSWVAQAGTAPLVLYYFSHFPVYFWLSNLVVAPLLLLILYGALATFVFSPVPWVHSWLVTGMETLLHGLNVSMQWVEQLPVPWEGEPPVSPIEICIGYLIVVMGWKYHRSHKGKYVVGLGVGLNLLLISRLCVQMYGTEPPGLLLARAQVQCYPEATVWQEGGIYHHRGVTVCLLSDDRWQRKTSTERLDIDYLYVCRGYKGKLEALQPLFRIKTVVLDASLSEYRQKHIKAACDKLKIAYIDLSDKGSYRIIR